MQLISRYGRRREVICRVRPDRRAHKIWHPWIAVGCSTRRSAAISPLVRRIAVVPRAVPISSSLVVPVIRPPRLGSTPCEDGFGFGCRPLEYVLFNDRPLKLSATFFETRTILKSFKRPSDLLVYAGEREVVCRVSEVSLRVERFLDAQPVMRLLLQGVTFVPSLLFSWNWFPLLD